MNENPLLSGPSYNALTYGEVQDRLLKWQTIMQEMFKLDYEVAPRSVFISAGDLIDIFEAFKVLSGDDYILEGARLYFNFNAPQKQEETTGPGPMSVMMLPVVRTVIKDEKDKERSSDSTLTAHDLILNLDDPQANTVTRDTKVSVYDFNQPCPPIGSCFGLSSVLMGKQPVQPPYKTDEYTKAG